MPESVDTATRPGFFTDTLLFLVKSEIHIIIPMMW